MGGQFRKSLEQLMSQLTQTEPFFVRCLKPNEFKRVLNLDRELVLRQLRYSGMMETIKIRRSGYPVRYTYQQFVDRYRMLIDGVGWVLLFSSKILNLGPSHKVDCQQATKKICDQVLGNNSDFQLGKTKVFLKDKQDLFLEQVGLLSGMQGK